MTKSVTKLGMEHLKMASLPTMMLSGEMLISYLWFVTEIRKQDDNMQGRTTSPGENEKRIPRVYWDAQESWHSSDGYRTVGCWEHCPPSPPRTLSSQSPRRSSAPSIWILHRCQQSHSHEICQPQNVDLSLKNCKKKKYMKKGSIQLFLEAMHNSTWCTVMHGNVSERNEDALGWSVPRELVAVPRSMPSESTQLRTLTKSDTKLGMEHLKMASLPSITVSWNVWHSYACWETEN